MLHPSFFDELHNPARIEIDTKANAAAILAEMLDGQAQTSWTRWPKHEPIRAFGKVLIGKSFAENLIVDAKIFNVDAGFGDAGGAAGFESIDRLMSQGLGDPASNRAASEPFVFEK